VGGAESEISYRNGAGRGFRRKPDRFSDLPDSGHGASAAALQREYEIRFGVA